MSEAKQAFIVSGAGSGIGQAIAQILYQKGHSVFGLGRDIQKLSTTAKLLGERFNYADADLANGLASEKAFAKIHLWLTKNHFQLVGLVNNAGVFTRQSFLQTSDEIWQHQFANNLLSGVRLTREFHGALMKAKGSVLNVGSTLGQRSVAMTAAYSAMKAAMISWTQTLALEWATDGIRVNCVCPGLIDTPIHSFYGQSESAPERLQAHKAQPLQRMGTPVEIAEAAYFLLSDQSRWTTGSILTVDGGIHL